MDAAVALNSEPGARRAAQAASSVDPDPGLDEPRRLGQPRTSTSRASSASGSRTSRGARRPRRAPGSPPRGTPSRSRIRTPRCRDLLGSPVLALGDGGPTSPGRPAPAPPEQDADAAQKPDRPGEPGAGAGAGRSLAAPISGSPRGARGTAPRADGAPARLRGTAHDARTALEHPDLPLQF